MSHLTDCLAFTFTQEGGYQHLPGDSGNWTGGRVGVGVLVGTNMGISAPVLAHWRQGGVITAADMENLSRDEATAIAGALFGNPLRIEDLPPGPDLMTFELAWGSGLRFGAQTLQNAVGAPADGFIGPTTVAAAQAADAGAVIIAIDAAVRRYDQSLQAWAEFGDGWTARSDRRVAAARVRAGVAAAVA
jgi:lysozyme family protein